MQSIIVRRSTLESEHWRRLWKMKCPGNIKHFFWRLAHDLLALRMNLERRGMELNTRCVMCNRRGEEGGVRPGAAGLLTGIECSRVRDSSWMYLISKDAPQDEDEATRTARRARNRRKEERRVHAAERTRLPPRNLNNEFNNVADPVFRTPIAAMTEATLRLMTMPRNPETERVINLAKNAVEQLERQNP